MPEIGETLREARMRRRIDMTEVETATKIRGKYLRALENEEWDLLPGPTFVKSFLRTYAEYLGLDARLLVEEYRQRYERPSTQDLTPFSAARRGGRTPRRRQRVAAHGAGAGHGRRPRRAAGVLLPARASGARTTRRRPAGGRGARHGDADPDGNAREARREAVASVSGCACGSIATGPVYVCLVERVGASR